MSKMKVKVEELCNLNSGLKVFSIGHGDKEGFAKSSTSVGNRTTADFLLPRSNKQYLVP